MDVRDMSGITDRSIDVAFDKGTLDSMIYGSPWSPPDEVKENMSQYLKEISFEPYMNLRFSKLSQGLSSVERQRCLPLCHVPTTAFYAASTECGWVMGFRSKGTWERGFV